MACVAMASYLRARVRGRACKRGSECVGWSGRRRPIKEVGCQTQGRLEL